MPDLNVNIFVTGPLQVNTPVVWCSETREALVFDPGGGNSEILGLIDDHDLKLQAVVNTHGHADHLGGVAELCKTFKIPFRIHKGDEMLVQEFPHMAAMYGFRDAKTPEIGSFLEDGEELKVGEFTLEVRHTPGHSPGGCAFVGAGMAIVGDTLFQGSIGRTDLPGGSFETLMNSIHSKLMTLPDETRVICGHMGVTTIGDERKHNPFINGSF